jgi:hypothetical protein
MTNEHRRQVYERFLHRVALYADTFNNLKVQEAVTLICSWSYAHRSGNGELSEYEQQKRIDHVIERMDKFLIYKE